MMIKVFLVLILLLAFIDYLKDNKMWNSGLCRNCGFPLAYSGKRFGRRYYYCPLSSREISVWWPVDYKKRRVKGDLL